MKGVGVVSANLSIQTPRSFTSDTPHSGPVLKAVVAVAQAFRYEDDGTVIDCKPGSGFVGLVRAVEVLHKVLSSEQYGRLREILCRDPFAPPLTEYGIPFRPCAAHWTRRVAPANWKLDTDTFFSVLVDVLEA